MLVVLIQAVVLLVILGCILYLVEAYVPMSPPIKTVLRIVIVLIVAIWLLRFAGLLGGPIF